MRQRFALSFACALALAACGREDAAPASPTAQPSAIPQSPPHATAEIAPATTPAAPSTTVDAARRIEADVRFLSDDLMEGREAGTRGYELAARYVAAQYQSLGLEPAGDAGTYFQTVPLVRGQRIADGAKLEIEANGKRQSLVFMDDFMPAIHFTDGAFEVTAPLVFAGHAVHAPELQYDDFANIDVKGKIALVFSNAPSRFPNDHRAYYASSAYKMKELESRGAVGVIYLGDPKEEAKRAWEIGVKNWQRSGMRLVDAANVAVDDFPAVKGRASVRASRVEALLAGSDRKAADLFQQLHDGKLQGFDLPAKATIAGKSETSRVESRNVAAKLPGSDATLAAEHIVFTAHLDHVGIGAEVDGDTIYNGAIDNALGVAIMLEAARELLANERPKRSILFVAVTAEEKGLLGAEHFARNPTVAKESLIANVNMDMPILLQPQEDVVPTGVEHSTLEAAFQSAAKELGVKISPDPMPEEVIFIRSDQYPFIKQGIPAVFLNGGVIASPGASDPGASMREFLTRHYHLPSDDVSQSIHYPSAARLAKLNRLIGTSVANAAERPQWKTSDFFGEKFGKK